MTTEKPPAKTDGESMKVLVDTNVLLDYFLTRKPFFEAANKMFLSCLFTLQGYIASHTFVDLFYQMHERSGKSVEYCRNTFLKLCQIFEVCSIDKQRIIDASQNLEFNDFEDSLQNACASYSGVDYIITRNADDFESATVPVISPEDFARLMVDNQA